MILECARYASAKSAILLLIVVLSLLQGASAQIVSNGGFETGNFSGWSLSGNTEGASVSTASAYVHSGQYGAQLGPNGSLGYLSQTIPTEAGTTYVLSFWLNSQGGITNEFLVSWNGTTLFDQTNVGVTGWTNMQFAVQATETSTLLEFGFRNDPSYFGLDDITVGTNGSLFKLMFTTAPSGTNAGSIFGPIVVQAEDVAGNPIATNGLPVTIALNTGSGPLIGTLTQPTDATGKATFDGLSIDLAGMKSLQASASVPSLIPATSGSFLITPAAATQLALISSASPLQTSGTPFSPAPVVEVLDRFGNAVSNSTAPITAMLSSSGGGSLGGANTANADGVDGLASFDNLRYILANPGLAESVVFYFTSPGLPPVTNSPITVDFVYTYTTITLTNGNSVIQIDPTSQNGLFSWTVEGTNQMNQQWFWLRQDPGTTQISFDQFGTPYGLFYNSTNAVINYLPPGLNVTLSFTLNGGKAGSYASELTETISIQNTNTNSVGLHFYDYTDFDLAGEAPGDTVLFPITGTVIQQGKGMTATQIVQGPAPTFWEGSWYALTLDEIDDATIGILSDEIIPNEPGDQTFAYQWDFTLAAGQTFVVSLTNSIRPEPIQLSIAPSGSEFVISWPTNSLAGFQLQSSSNLVSGGNWILVTNQPAVAGELYQVTLPHTGSAQFYRLQQ